MKRVLSLICLAVGCASLIHCSDGPKILLDVLFRELPDEVDDDIASIELGLIHDANGAGVPCDALRDGAGSIEQFLHHETLLSRQRSEDGEELSYITSPLLDDVAGTVVGFAYGSDDTCTVIAQGCSESHLDEPEGRLIIVRLLPLDPPRPCAGECIDGVCVP